MQAPCPWEASTASTAPLVGGLYIRKPTEEDEAGWSSEAEEEDKTAGVLAAGAQPRPAKACSAPTAASENASPAVLPSSFYLNLHLREPTEEEKQDWLSESDEEDTTASVLAADAEHSPAAASEEASSPPPVGEAEEEAEKEVEELGNSKIIVWTAVL